MFTSRLCCCVSLHSSRTRPTATAHAVICQAQQFHINPHGTNRRQSKGNRPATLGQPAEAKRRRGTGRAAPAHGTQHSRWPTCNHACRRYLGLPHRLPSHATHSFNRPHRALYWGRAGQVESHESTAGGGLVNRKHFDGGSLVTCDIMLASTKDFTGRSTRPSSLPPPSPLCCYLPERLAV